MLLVVFLLGSVVYAQAKKPVPAKKAPPKKVETVQDENWIGIQAHYLTNSTPAGKVNGYAAGGGLQFEPDFLNISESMKMGYIMEYARSTGGADYKMFNNILYLQYHKVIGGSKILDFYGNLGVGGSYVSYTKDKEKFEGLDPMLMTEIGWQGLKFSNFVVRVGLRGNLIVEKYIAYGSGGLQVSFLMSF